MLGKNCFLRYCNATVGDCKKNATCPCLSCFGTKQDTCTILEKEVKFNIDLQRTMCSGCKNYNGK